MEHIQRAEYGVHHSDELEIPFDFAYAAEWCGVCGDERRERNRHSCPLPK
jgi:hypothetical protein